MHRYLWLLLLPTLMASAAAPEDEARAVHDRWNAAWKAKDSDTMSRLLADDFVIIMTDPAAGAEHARFFTRETYLKRLQERFAKAEPISSSETIRAMSVSEKGEVFMITESEETARVGQRNERFRYHTYAVLRPVNGKMLIRLAVSQLVSYSPSIPDEPTKK